VSSTDQDAAESPFDVVSEVSVTRSEKIANAFDRHVVTPARIIAEDRRSLAGLAILVVYLLMGTVGVRVIDAPQANEGPRLQSPFVSAEFPLGTDAMGQDILAMLVHATPTMLLMLLSGAVFATAVATVVGTVTGYKGGLVDDVLTTVTDVVMTIPGLPLIIVLAATFEPSDPLVIGVLLTINAWAGLARSLRSEVLSLREANYVEASRLMGVPTWKIIWDDILPNLMPYILINFMNAGRTVIFNSVGLYFLGILPFSSLNWGVMLDMAVSNNALLTMTALHWVVLPTLTIVMLSYGLILLSQGMDRLFNPRVRARKQD
jgi:peptide/nickel transport system permease protein